MKRFFPSILIALLLLAGCRGMEKERPPFHPNLNMDFQESFEPQERNPFFADDAAMRQPVPGTIARGFLREDTRFYYGRTGAGDFVEEIPVPVTLALLERGQERYDIFCSMCHGSAGDGNGIIMTGGYGYTPAPTYHSDRLREVPDGYLYDVIANGVRNMPAYGAQVPVADRWAIVAYLRALQRSQYSTEEDIPPSIMRRIEQEGAANIEGGQQGMGASDTSAAAAAASGGTTAPTSAPATTAPTDTAQ